MSIRVQLRRDTAANWLATNPVLSAGEVGYETDTKKFKFGDGTSAWTAIGYSQVPINPSKRGNTYSRDGLVNYINAIAIASNYSSEVYALTHGASALANAYCGTCYSPNQNRLYFIPNAQATAEVWHYLDCANGSLTAYTHGATVVDGGAYLGACYSQTQDRIYMVPNVQSTAAVWHYIDCTASTVLVTPYTHGATVVATAYAGGVYSPTQNRIFLVPAAQSTAVVWHFIDCSVSSSLVTPYTHGATVVANGYVGGVYSPSQDRIYLVPNTQATATVWHYIDCTVSSSLITSYTHGATVVATGYAGGVYAPLQNRIYFIPYSQSTATVWHYVNCANASTTITPYTHGQTVVATGYLGAVYVPTMERMYLCPYSQSTATVWHYIDCLVSSALVTPYTHGKTVVATGYYGGGYSPSQNRVYFSPYAQATATTTTYLDCDPGIGAYPSKFLMAGAMFNKL